MKLSPITLQQKPHSFVYSKKTNRKIMVNFLVLSLAVFISARLLDGVEIRSYWTALGVALGLSLVNVLLKPILVVLSIPFIVLTLGLFMLVINAALIMLIDKLVDGLRIRNFTWAAIFSLLISLINIGLNALL